MLNRQLPPPLVHLILSAFCALCFAIVAQSVAAQWAITNFDAAQAERFWDFSQRHPAVWNVALWTTDLGAGRPRTFIVAGVTIILICLRQWRLALFWAGTQWLVRDLVGTAKDTFERPRPHFEGTTYVAPGWSFPSGHATGAMATYAMIAFLVVMRWPGRWRCWPIVAGLCSIILLVGLSRMLLGVHYFTDVLGGYFLGLAWVSLCVAAIEWVRGHTERRVDAGKAPS
jgi:membrane-associated phospholipid phosphatase